MYLDQYFEMIRAKLISKVKWIYAGKKNPYYFTPGTFIKQK